MTTVPTPSDAPVERIEALFEQLSADHQREMYDAIRLQVACGQPGAAADAVEDVPAQLRRSMVDALDHALALVAEVSAASEAYHHLYGAIGSPVPEAADQGFGELAGTAVLLDVLITIHDLADAAGDLGGLPSWLTARCDVLPMKVATVKRCPLGRDL